MRIGIMVRAVDEKGGVGVYTRNVTQELLNLDRGHTYVLYYRTAAQMGSFFHVGSVTERLLPVQNKVAWDQVAMPRACRDDGLDVVFHPKFTVPMLAPCPAVMVLHGAGWFLPGAERYWSRWELAYVRRVMPMYCRKAAAILSVSEQTTEVFNRVLNLPEGKVRTVYFAPARQFRPVSDPGVLQAARERYNLPPRFVLTLSKAAGGARKNFGRLLEAYRIYHGSVPDPHPLVVGGRGCERFRVDYGIPAEGYGRDVLFPGWIDQVDLPAVYSLADGFVYPSNQEAFPIPITEAMACGTPIITSQASGLKELAGDAALFVDPTKGEDIAETLRRLLSQPDLLTELSRKGLARSQDFSWDRCARETLDILEQVGAARSPAGRT